MPFINGQWIDEEQARMMAMRGVNPMIYGGTFDTPMIYGGTTDVPDPMLYGGTTDVPGSMAFQGEGMLSPTLPNPLQAFTEPAFTQPLAALNSRVKGIQWTLLLLTLLWGHRWECKRLLLKCKPHRCKLHQYNKCKLRRWRLRRCYLP